MSTATKQFLVHVALVGFGGGAGAIARYLLGGWILHRTENWLFPLSTFVVNLLGCLIAGVLWGVAEHWEMFSAEAKLLLFTGLLGGFTTFSAFGLDTVHLLRRGAYGVAGANMLLSVLCGVGITWLAIWLMTKGK